MTGAIAAKDEARVRAVPGMEGAERKGGSAGWCNWVTMLIESIAPGPCIIFKGSLKPVNPIVHYLISGYPHTGKTALGFCMAASEGRPTKCV